MIKKAEDRFCSALSVLQMCSELHQRGYQKLRIYPALSPSGTHWRLALAPACCFSRWCLPPQARPGLIAHYSNTDQEALIHWTANDVLTPPQLADKFIFTFPKLTKHCKGHDAAYSLWLQELTEQCIEHRTLPWFQADWDYDLSHGVPLTNGQTFRLPPEAVPGRWGKLRLKLLGF